MYSKKHKRIMKNIIEVLALCITAGAVYFCYTSYTEYQEELAKKEKQIKMLEQKHEEDIALISTDISEYEQKVNELQVVNETLKQEKEQLNQTVNQLQGKVTELEKELSSRTLNLNASNYTAMCSPITINGRSYQGCSGITATGVDVTKTEYYNGLRIVATDPDVIPLKSILRLYYNDGTTEEVIAMDTGGYIKGNKIDILVKDEKTATEFGRQQIKAVVLKWG